jgi:PPM family protein phosphatase
MTRSKTMSRKESEGSEGLSVLTPSPAARPSRDNKPPKAAALKWFGWTDIGRVRKNNEDSFLGLVFDAHEVHRLGKFGESSLETHDFTFAVCDGMGGAKAGEYASQIAVDKITTLLPRAFQNSARGLNAGFADVLAELYSQVHRALVYLGRSYDECHGMQTTMSLCWFTPGWMYFGHVGDTRIYHLPAGKSELNQLTDDDTHVGWLLRNGKINDYEARTHPRRNVLQKALGGENQFVDPQLGAVECGRGDMFLLCSDGMTEGLYEHQIVDVLRVNKKDFNPAKVLVESAVKSDGRDNTTALVVRVV